MHAYTRGGQFKVSLTVDDGRGGTNTASTTATINSLPIASAGGPYTGTVGQAISFDARASSDPDGDALQYAWTFGDGGIGTGASPSHTYTSPGTFTATVTVTDGRGGSASASSSVTVAPPNRVPTASAGGPYAGTVGAAIAFDASGSTDPDGDPLQYAWTFGDGGTGSGASPTHTYTSAGTFAATVTVSDGHGGLATASAQVTVSTVQPAVLTLSITEPTAGRTVPTPSITVRGTVSDPTARVVVQNVVASVVGTTFEARNITLSEGRNDLAVRATTIAGQQASSTLNVTLDSIAPALTVFSPPDRSLFTAASATVSAAALDATSLLCSINGAPVAVQSGLFSSIVALSSGSNTVSVSCVDAAGHTASRTLMLFQDDAPLVVSGVDPADGATAVPTSAPVTITFSEPIECRCRRAQTSSRR
jgi:PKD repeat protein